MGEPKYKTGDKVSFKFRLNTKLIGIISIVDKYGTFEQDKEPSYDIEVAEGKFEGLHKHIVESKIRLIKRGNTDET